MRKMLALLLAVVLGCMCGCGAKEDMALMEPTQEQTFPLPTEAPTEAVQSVADDTEPPTETTAPTE